MLLIPVMIALLLFVPYIIYIFGAWLFGVLVGLPMSVLVVLFPILALATISVLVWVIERMRDSEFQGTYEVVLMSAYILSAVVFLISIR